MDKARPVIPVRNRIVIPDKGEAEIRDDAVFRSIGTLR